MKFTPALIPIVLLPAAVLVAALYHSYKSGKIGLRSGVVVSREKSPRLFGFVFVAQSAVLVGMVGFLAAAIFQGRK